MKRFPMLPYWIVLALLFVIAMAPIGVTIYAANVAEGHGCQISEGVIVSCVIDGVDRGAELQQLGSAFWYALFTWPAAITGVFLWLVVLMVHRRQWKKRMYPDG